MGEDKCNETKESLCDGEYGILFLNAKRAYDEYQDLALKVARDVHGITMQIFQNGITASQRAVTNALTADHIASLQALGHRDITFDAQVDQRPPDEGKK